MRQTMNRLERIPGFTLIPNEELMSSILRPAMEKPQPFYIQFSANCVFEGGAEQHVDALLGYNDDAVFELRHARPFNTEQAAILRVKRLRKERKLYHNPIIRSKSQVSVQAPSVNPLLIV